MECHISDWQQAIKMVGETKIKGSRFTKIISAPGGWRLAISKPLVGLGGGGA